MSKEKDCARPARGISRRDFAKRTALAAAAATVLPSELLSPSAARAAASPPLPQQTTTEAPKLSPASRAEVDAKIQAIFRRYGSRLSDAEKADVRRLMTEGQKPLEELRAFPLENGDGPATVLRPYRAPAQPPRPVPRPARPRARRRKGA
jgi:hypothetical protein